MPVYEYFCRNCNKPFEAYYKLSQSEGQKSSPCPACRQAAARVFTPIAIPRVERTDSDLMDDPPEYRNMHYYEKRRDWRRAADAAEGVSEYANQKFLQKAQEEGG